MRAPAASHLANLDLNLLVSLRELLRERNVTRAAARVGITQPAASAALSRLRRHFDDELLTRHHGSYVLTPLAAQLAEQVEGVCAAAERLFSTGRRFDPATTRRGFTLLLADYTIAVLGTALSSALAARAPGVELRLRLVREAFTADIAETSRLIDGVIAPPSPRFDRPDLHSVELFRDRWVLLLDAGHPAADDELTPAVLATLPWVVPFAPDRGFSTAVPMTRELARLGIEPDTRVRVESYLGVPHLVAGTDRVALVQERLAREVAPRLGLVVREAPASERATAAAEIRERLWWHADLDGDPAHRWLRELLVELGAAA
ncbi:LysR family transcriptional regulator [Actinomycetospora chlora]|uniref:LysR family transcriptional regulator n=1 Tax=Actinomycetospora chlora TaxID=663608 RepID=A0ABP9AJ82_9PSEU